MYKERPERTQSVYEEAGSTRQKGSMMKRIALDCLPYGKKKAVTMSFDDGRPADIPLAALFEKYGIKGTFHYNSENIGTEGYLTPEQVKEVGRYHEISCHGATHPFLEQLPLPVAVQEIVSDRMALEPLAGKPVRGMSYPYGTYSAPLKEALRAAGMEYSRTIANTGEFDLPGDFMEWHPTCHQANENIEGLFQKFLNKKKHIRVFYVWGHSYELDRDGSWDRMEKICQMLSHREEIWYATNLEICDYVTAMRNLRFTADRSMVYNPGGLDVWIWVNDREAVRVPAGATISL